MANWVIFMPKILTTNWNRSGAISRPHDAQHWPANQNCFLFKRAKGIAWMVALHCTIALKPIVPIVKQCRTRYQFMLIFLLPTQLFQVSEMRKTLETIYRFSEMKAEKKIIWFQNFRLLFVAQYNPRIVVHAMFVFGAGSKWQEIWYPHAVDICLSTCCHRLRIEYARQSGHASTEANSMYHHNAYSNFTFRRQVNALRISHNHRTFVSLPELY